MNSGWYFVYEMIFLQNILDMMGVAPDSHVVNDISLSQECFFQILWRVPSLVLVPSNSITKVDQDRMYF